MTPKTTPTEWDAAQQFEAGWWDQLTEEARQEEMFKHAVLCRHVLGISPASLHGRHVLDVACGPIGLLAAPHTAGRAVAVDPLRFSPELEEQYARHGVERVFSKGEELTFDNEFNEVWCYNGLQHVQDPTAVLQNMMRALRKFGVLRLVEWRDVPPYEGHPHTITEALIVKALRDTKYGAELWELGTLHGPTFGTSGKYVAFVLRKH